MPPRPDLKLRAGSRARRGVSLFEAMVVLVVSSLVLSIILPLASRSVRDNVRIGAHGLNAQQASLDEEVFRRILRGAAQAPASVGQSPDPFVLTGDERALSVSTIPEVTSGCAEAGGVRDVRLVIASVRDGVTLTCESGERAVVLLRLAAGSAATFAYSADGRSWSETWPLEEALSQVVSTMDAMGRARQPMAEAPLVRLSLRAPNGRSALWIEQAGRPAPLGFAQEGATSVTSPADLDFVP